MGQVNIPDFLPGRRMQDGESLSSILASSDTFLAGILKGANMNTTADQAIPLSLPPASAGGSGRYTVQAIYVCNPSVSLTTAAGGIYTAPAKGGVAVVASGQAYSGLTQALVNVAGSLLSLTMNLATAFFTTPTLYFSLTTAQGAAATADIYVIVQPLP